jgi:hypothetical protein
MPDLPTSLLNVEFMVVACTFVILMNSPG